MHMLTEKQQQAPELQTLAVAGIGRLLLHAGYEAQEQLQTEQLVAALVQIYIQRPSTAGSLCLDAYEMPQLSRHSGTVAADPQLYNRA